MIWRGLLSPARKVERVDGTQPCWCDACGVSLPKVRRVIFQAKRLIPSGTCHPLVAAVITSKRKDSRGRRLGGNAICTHGRRRLENTNTRAHAREIRDPQDPSYRLYGVVFIKAENICARIVWYCIVLFCTRCCIKPVLHFVVLHCFVLVGVVYLKALSRTPIFLVF